MLLERAFVQTVIELSRQQRPRGAPTASTSEASRKSEMELSRSNYGRFRIQSLYVQIGRAPLPERPVFATCSGSRRHHTEQPDGTQAPIGHGAKDRGRRGSGLVQHPLC